MNIAKEKLDNYEVALTIELEAPQLDKAKKTAAKNLSNRVSIPGFRKGKAPLEVIERHVGKQTLMDEAAELLIQEAANQALKDEKLTPADEIKYDVITNEDGKDFVFKMRFTPYPKVTLGEYKGLTIDKYVEEVTDADVEKQLEVLRDHHATMTEAGADELSVEGDFVLIDFDGFLDGKAFEGGVGRSQPVTIGSGKFIPGFEDQLIGHKVGDEFEVKVKFPEDYHSDDLAGKDATFKCKLLSLKHRQLPALDDAFAIKASSFKTLAEFRENIRKNMVDNANRKAIEIQQEALIDKITENITVDVPPVMIDNQVNQVLREQELQLQANGMSMGQFLQVRNLTMDELKSSLREGAEHTVRMNLMLEAVAEAENIHVEDQDYRYEVAVLAATYNIPPKEIQKIIRKEGQGPLLVSQALKRKVIAFLIKNNIMESKSDQSAQPSSDQPSESKSDAATESATDAKTETAQSDDK